MSRLIGAHMPTSGGLAKAVTKGKEIGCTAVQVFTSSPQQWKAKAITEDVRDAFLAARKESEIDALVSHDSYLVNLAAADTELRNKSIGALTSELERCHALQIPYVVSHMGAHTGAGEQNGLELLAKSAREVLANSPKSVSLAMETTAGQGTCLGYKLEHLAYVIEKNKGNSRLVVCIDTCHLFAAGYDLRTEQAYEETVQQIQKIIGLDRVRVIHANDSLRPFNSRKDRHAHIGQGEIGELAFRLLVNDQRLAHAPIIVETPDAETMHETNVGRLKSYLESGDGKGRKRGKAARTG